VGPQRLKEADHGRTRKAVKSLGKGTWRGDLGPECVLVSVEIWERVNASQPIQKQSRDEIKWPIGQGALGGMFPVWEVDKSSINIIKAVYGTMPALPWDL
jgi:hypothetical protein